MKKKKDRKELAEKMSFEDIYKEVSILKMGLLKVTDDDGETHLIQSFEDAYDHCPDFRHYVDKYKDTNFKKYLEQTEGTFANYGCLAKDTHILTNGG